MATPVTDLILSEVTDLLNERSVVVWYDPQQELSAAFEVLQKLNLERIDARPSLLRARQAADRHWNLLAATPSRWMVIYVPWERGATEEARVREPFEAYACIGAAYGVDPAQQLESLARKAMPHRKVEIDRLYAEHRRVTLQQLEALAAQAGFPLLKQAIDTEDPIEVGARLIATRERLRAALGAAGVQGELSRLLRDAFGFDSPAELSALQPAFTRWILFSELSFDVAGNVPAHTAHQPRAPAPYAPAVYLLCDRLRGTEEWQDAYVAAATEVEKDLRLGGLSEDASSWGDRDTFAAEDRASLRFVQAECLAGRLDSARRTLDLRRRSIWTREPVRGQLWQLAGRALELLEAGARWRFRSFTSAKSVKDHVLAYVSEHDGLWQVDRAERWMAKAAGDCLEREVLQPLVEHVEGVYRQAIDAAQGAFLEAVVRDGWPPEVPKQVQVFARHVGPALQAGERVAYFLMDALRFEMGRDLGHLLETLKLGSVRVEETATVVPTTTPFGMAALLPGAETTFACELRDGEIVPTVGGKPMATVDDRGERFREQLGDRYVDLRLDQLLDAKDAKLKERIGRASLLVVRSDDIDKAGEHTNLPSARRFMSSILDDAARVAQRLARAGVTRMVFAADHGYVLLREVPPGDVVKTPPGEWRLSKRRCRLGSAAGSIEGVRVVPAGHLGVHGPVKDVALATGFRVFTGGAGYFHEGMSLQECLVPVVVLEVRQGSVRPQAGSTMVDVIYKKPQYTQRIFIVRLKLSSLVEPEVDVRVVAVAPGPKGRHEQVGQAADGEARDPATGLIHLRTGVEEQVAIRIQDDFSGPEIEIRVLDGGGAGVVLGSKKLKNACMD
jgi:hypothetical protein